MSPLASPTLRAHTLLQDRVSSIKSRLDIVRIEAVTGRASDVGRAVDGDIGKVQRLGETLAYAEDRASTLAFAGSRAATAQQVLGSVREQAADARNALLSGLSGAAPQALASAQGKAESAFEDSISRLNGQFAGRALFGGDETGAPFGAPQDIMNELRTVYSSAPDTTSALSAIDTFFNDPAGDLATHFFQGGDGEGQSVELAKGQRIASSVKGDSSEIRAVLHGLAVTALAAEAPTSAARLQTAQAGGELIGAGVDRLIDLQGRLGVTEERIAMARTNYEAEATSLSIAMNGLVGRDQAEAATEMRMLESQLEAAYLTTTRMANLTLVNYLR